MGSSHAATGAAAWLAGCATAAVLGHQPGVYELVAGTPLAAFGAILSDIDHRSSSVAHSLGWPTRKLAGGVARFGKWLHATTRTPLDGRDEDGHRTITHGVLFAVLMFLAFGWLGVHGAWYATMAMTAFAAATGLRALKVRSGRYVLAAAVAAAAWWWPAPSGWWLGWAIGAGVLVHSLGDWLTNTGVPLLFPIKFRGRRWYKFRAPRWIRFDTSARSWREGAIRWCCGLACTLAAAGMLYVRWPAQVRAVVEAIVVTMQT
jgi:membrane-bound metal-dependent hydrolase YbcI (DUF457 family)